MVMVEGRKSLRFLKSQMFSWVLLLDGAGTGFDIHLIQPLCFGGYNYTLSLVTLLVACYLCLFFCSFASLFFSLDR